ncbi:MAG: CCA tRNA nucleotidyltransferase [Bacteroidota bacterium]
MTGLSTSPDPFHSALKLIAQTVAGSVWQGKVFAAGGMVRDQLMGNATKDIDLTIAAPQGGIEFANWLAIRLGIHKDGSNPVIFPRFGTAKLSLAGISHNGIDLSPVDIETVMTRKEYYSEDSRKPEVEYGTPEEDVLRRDLTINALLMDIVSGEILDYTGKGVADIKSKTLRTPLDPDVTFTDDPLRMLRVIRFAVKLGWGIPFSMIKALRRNAKTLRKISAERKRDELSKILLSSHPHTGVRLLEFTGLNAFVIPEFQGMVGMSQNNFHEWTAERHTYEVLKNSPAELTIRLAALLHDIGKVETRKVENGHVSFLGHETRSADLSEEILRRLKYPNEITDAVVALVQHHMRTKQFGTRGEKASDKSLRKLMHELGDNLNPALQLIHSDNISHGNHPWPHNMPDQVPELKRRIADLGPIGKRLNLPIDGNEIIRILTEVDPKFKPGPIMQKIYSAIEEEFLENPQLTNKQAQEIVILTYRNTRS